MADSKEEAVLCGGNTEDSIVLAVKEGEDRVRGG